MNITKVRAFQDNYIWILADENQKICHCIDPGDAAPVVRFLESTGLQLSNILLTHHHFDHQGGVNKLAQQYPDIKVYGPDDARIPSIAHKLKDGDVLDISDMHFKILSIPGHTSTHIAYYEDNKNLLFCGDTLFSAGCGRIFDGTAEQLYQSLQLLKTLPDKTKVYCAHEYTKNNLLFARTVEPENEMIQRRLNEIEKKEDACTLPSIIELEKQINPFLRIMEPAVIKYASQRGSGTSPVSVFKCVREQKDSF